MTASCCAIVYLQQLMPLLTPPHQPQLLHRPRLDPEAGFILHHLEMTGHTIVSFSTTVIQAVLVSLSFAPLDTVKQFRLQYFEKLFGLLLHTDLDPLSC